jgi:phospholipid/cholesterol/gamma-HCH transport system substrate-binding protein
MRIVNRGPKILGLLVFAAICSGIFVWLFTAAGGHIRLSRPFYANARVPTAFQLVSNGDVRSAGVKVGVVSKIDNAGDTGTVEFEITKKGFRVYKDAVVQVRTKTLVGENYLDIDPGTPTQGGLPKGGTLPLAQAKDAVQLDQILDSLGPAPRRRVAQNHDALGPGLDGRGGDHNPKWAAMKPNAQDGGVVLRVLASQKRELAGLVANTGEVMQAFGDRGQQVQTLARQAKRTAVVASGRDAQMRSAIREIAPTLTQARSSVRTLGDFASRSTPVVSDLADVSGQLQPIVEDLRPAVTATRTLFRDLPASLRVTNPLVQQLTPFAEQLTPAVAALESFLRQAGPAVEYLKPFSGEIGSMFANNGSVFATKDAIGNKGRVHAILSASSIAAFNDDEKKLLEALVKAGAAQIYNGERMNNYPKPGDITSPQDGNGAFPRVEAGP